MGIGSQFVEEDYKNYLQYLKVVVPSEYKAHKRMFDECTIENNDDMMETQNEQTAKNKKQK